MGTYLKRAHHRTTGGNKEVSREVHVCGWCETGAVTGRACVCVVPVQEGQPLKQEAPRGVDARLVAAPVLESEVREVPVDGCDDQHRISPTHATGVHKAASNNSEWVGHPWRTAECQAAREMICPSAAAL